MGAETMTTDTSPRGPLTGGCLCGAVRFTAAAPSRAVSACHCDMCRRWTGGPEFAVDCGTAVTFEDERAISVYRSSAWGERAFCARCGSGLFFRFVETGVLYVNAGVFDDQSGFALAEEIFVDEKPGWCALAGDTVKKTGAEVMAELSGGEP
jgi:hypothetical protein